MRTDAHITTRGRQLAAVISTIAVYGLTAGLGYPLISLNLEARGVDASLIGLNAAMLALAMLLLSPVMPGLIARFGFRPLVLVALSTETLCFVVLPLSENLWFWMLVRATMGASATVLFIAAETWVNEVAEDNSRGRVIGLYITALSLAFAMGPLLIPLTGYLGWLPFLTAAGLLLLAGLPMLAAGNTARTASEQPASGLLGFVRQAPVLCGAVLLFAFIDGSAMPLLPVYGLELGYGAAEAAIFVTVRAIGGVCFQFPMGWLADRYDRRRLMIGCVAGALACTLALPFCSANPLLLWPLLFVWGGLSTAVYTVAMVLLGQRYRGRDLATGNAAFGVMFGIGTLCGPIAGGAAMSALGPQALPGVITVAALVFLAFAMARGGLRR